MHWLFLQLFFAIILTVKSYKPSIKVIQIKHNPERFQGYRFNRRIQLQLSSFNPDTIITDALQNNLEVPTSSLIQASSLLTAVTADFAAQIEEAVGPEVYRPIFLYGIFLGFSGLIVCGIAALLITKFNLQEELNRQFDEGKQAQLIPLKEEAPSSSPSFFSAFTPSADTGEAQSIPNRPESNEDAKKRGGVSDDVVENIDI